LAFRKFLPIERLLQHFCKAIVGVSKYDVQNLTAEGIKKNVSTIYNGISVPDCSKIEDIDILNQGKKIILAIARVSPPKRTDLFIDIARLLPQYNFVWIGNQHNVTEFGELPENCHFLGNIPNAGAFCSRADLLMLTSDYEGLPMVILEAMSFGKPIIASDVGGVSEIVHNDINGYVLKNDANIFAEKIEHILDNEDAYRLFCKNSHKIFKEELTLDKMVKSYYEIYKK
jgi:glycosyltransferase involved in cell wall biosynthesis